MSTDHGGPRTEGSEVLLVEPDPRDAKLVSCGFKRQSVSLEVAPDGRTAIERLSSGSDDGTDDPLPRLVVIDFGVESINAETVLDAIKSSPRLGKIPVVVLTGGEGCDESTGLDIETAYDLGANAHFVKPDDIEQYVDGIERLAIFWFECATLPPENLYTDSRYY